MSRERDSIIRALITEQLPDRFNVELGEQVLHLALGTRTLPEERGGQRTSRFSGRIRSSIGSRVGRAAHLVQRLIGRCNVQLHRCSLYIVAAVRSTPRSLFRRAFEMIGQGRSTDTGSLRGVRSLSCLSLHRQLFPDPLAILETADGCAGHDIDARPAWSDRRQVGILHREISTGRYTQEHVVLFRDLGLHLSSTE